jgi:hypothetical protein
LCPQEEKALEYAKKEMESKAQALQQTAASLQSEWSKAETERMAMEQQVRRHASPVSVSLRLCVAVPVRLCVFRGGCVPACQCFDASECSLLIHVNVLHCFDALLCGHEHVALW